jgi:uronate dehydrogenase
MLVTGAAGSIGRVLCPGLTRLGHDLVGLDRVPSPDGFDGAWHTVDCADVDAVFSAFDAQSDSAQPLDAVVHLAGHPGEASLPDSLTSHVVTTAALLDAMVAHGVGRIVYASSNHAVGRTPRRELGSPGLLGAGTRPRPDTFYGVGKVAAEALLSLYADRYGLDAIACRIGSFQERPRSSRQLSTWLSPDDCVRMVQASLTAPAPGFAVLYGISANARAWWDLEPGRALGYEPEDDASAYEDEVEPAEADAVEAAHVGGPFVTEEFYRPALDRS